MIWVLEHVITIWSLQLLLALSIPGIIYASWRFPRNALYAGYVILWIWIGLEIALIVPLTIPSTLSVLPKGLVTVEKELYFKHWRVLFGGPGAMQYDPYVTYTLLPGTHQHDSVEFAVEVSVNSAGFRDDEASLNKPDVIILGDSYAMGWGVRQEEMFGQLLEKSTGLTVLNTGISSFGTVRELRLLKRIDRKPNDIVVIQYTENDMPENEAFAKNGDDLPITSEEEWVKQWQKQRENAPRYYPGKLTLKVLPKLIHDIKVAVINTLEKTPSPLFAFPAEEQATYFVHALETSSDISDQTPIFVVPMRFGPVNHAALPQAFHKQLTAAGFNNVHVIDVGDALNAEGYFVLDEHINAYGHHIVADALAEAIKSEGLLKR